MKKHSEALREALTDADRQVLNVLRKAHDNPTSTKLRKAGVGFDRIE